MAAASVVMSWNASTACRLPSSMSLTKSCSAATWQAQHNRTHQREHTRVQEPVQHGAHHLDAHARQVVFAVTQVGHQAQPLGLCSSGMVLQA